METRVYHQKSKPRKCFIYKKANWTAIHKDISYLNNNIETMTKEGNNVNILWKTFKTNTNRILRVKECAVQLAPILQKIFQVAIDTGDLPKDWRDANIFKKGDKHLPEN